MKILNSFITLNFLFIIISKYTKCNKEIILNDEQNYSINYIDRNIQNNETNIYYFITKKTTIIKFGITSPSINKEKFLITIYQSKDNNSIKIYDYYLEINQTIFKELNEENIEMKYYINYTYKEKHDIIFTASYLESNNKDEIYTITPTKYNSNLYYEYYSLEEYSIYFRIILYSFSQNQKIPMILTGDFENDQIIYNNGNNFQETPDKIIQNLDSSYNYISEKKYIDKSRKKIILYYQKQSYNILNLKIRVNNKNKGLQKIGISFVYKEEVIYDFGKKFMRNTGVFCILHFQEDYIQTNTTLFAYTNISSILKAYEIYKGQENNFIFGKDDNYYIKIYDFSENSKLALININKDFQLNKILIFCVENSNEDYIFQFFMVNNNNIQYSKYLKREEKINFVREMDHSKIIKNQTYLIINEYENNNDNYIYFNNLLYGDFKQKTINLDSEIYNKAFYDEKLYNPHLINSGIDISIFKIEDIQELYGFNEYKIKCDNHKYENLKKGDFIFICLKSDESTELNLSFKQNIKIQVTLLFNDNINFNYHCEIYSHNYKFNYNLTNLKYEIIENWENIEYGSILFMKNYNKIPIFLYLKLEAENPYIQILDKSQKDLKLEKNVLYSLLLPNNTSEGDVYGVYQELFASTEINNICIYHEIMNNEIFSFPPNSSCNNNFKNNKNLNITNYGIYSYNKNKNKKFYTHIYYKGEENVILNYKHMIISNKYLIHKKINKLDESNDIIYYYINEKIKDNCTLFLKLIKKDINEYNTIYIQSQGNNILNTNLFNYNNINIFGPNENNGKLFLIPKKDTIVFKFDESKKSLFYYEFGNDSMSYNYNEDINLKVDLIKDSNSKYILKFKPLETNGFADYEVFIFNSSSNYTIEILSNPYNIYDSEFYDCLYKIIFNDIYSNNNDFTEDIKSQFILDLEDIEKDNYNILLIGKKNNPSYKKFYSPVQLSLFKINFSKIKSTFCLNPNLNNENKFKISLYKDIYPGENGYLLIQWVNIYNETELKIYKGTEEENIIIYSSLKYENFYLLEANKVDKNFDIIYITNNSYNNIISKICFQYISSLGKTEYDNSEIEYKYFTSIIIPYYIKTNTSINIFKFKYNKDIIKDLKINVFYNNRTISNKNFTKENIKDIGEDSYYFGIYHFIHDISLTISIKIILYINNLDNYDIYSKLESFKIKWIQYNDLSINNIYNITINNISNFYFLDLNKYKEKNRGLFIFTDLYNKNGFFFYKNYFGINSTKVKKPLFSVDLEEINDSDYLIFITFSKKENYSGFIDISKLKGKFNYNENCNRKEKYNKVININKNEEVFYLCYYTKENNIKGKLFYNLEPESHNLLSLYYLNNFNLNKNSIINIIDDLENNLITKDSNNIFFGEIEIFKYKYISNNNTKLKLEFIEDYEINRTIYLEDIKNNTFYEIFSLSKYKNLILNLFNFSQEKGILIIQWIQNSKENFNKLKIYKGQENKNDIIYSSSNKDYYYLLDTTKVDDNFDIIYFLDNDNMNDNIIYLQYISFSENLENENSDIEYKYFKSINLPYYTNIKENIINYEIIQFNYNKNIINDLEISLYNIDNKAFNFVKNYSQSDLIDIEDDNYYMSVNAIYKNVYININLDSKNNIDFYKGESFFVKKMKLFNYLQFEYNNQTINNKTKLYLIKLNEFLQKDENLLFYTNLLNNGLNIYQNDIFSSNKTDEKLDKSFYSFSSEDILSLILYSKKETKGFIDFLKLNKTSSIIIEENCEIKTLFNKTYTLIKEYYYIICYNKNKNSKKYNITYDINNVNNNKINAYYSDIILSQNSIKDIFKDLSNKILIKNKFKLVKCAFDLSILKFGYEIRNNNTISNITFSIKNYFNEFDQKEKNDHGGLISAFLFLGAISILIGFFWFKTKNKDKNYTYSKSSSCMSSIINDSEKDTKILSLLK